MEKVHSDDSVPPEHKQSKLYFHVSPSTPQTNMWPKHPAFASIVGDIRYEINIQNVVSGVSVNCELNLQRVHKYLRNSEYSPKRFHGVVMRINNPRCTALIYRSGSIICTGARNEYESELGMRKIVRALDLIGFPVTYSKFKIHNMVATTDLRFPIRLDNLNQLHAQFSSYQPEIFPALVYRVIKPSVVMLIFVNGKIVFTAAKKRRDIIRSLDVMYPILLSFRKP